MGAGAHTVPEVGRRVLGRVPGSRRGRPARVRAIEHRVADSSGLRTTERTLSLRSPAVRVRVRTSDGPGEPVVWISGIGAPAMAFAPLLARLPGYRHFIVDLPGHNLAPPYRWQDRPLRDLAVDVVTGTLGGRVTVEILTDSWRRRIPLTAGQFVIVPRGHWHRHLDIDQVVEMYYTPGATIESAAEDPRAG